MTYHVLTTLTGAKAVAPVHLCLLHPHNWAAFCSQAVPEHLLRVYTVLAGTCKGAGVQAAQSWVCEAWLVSPSDYFTLGIIVCISIHRLQRTLSPAMPTVMLGTASAYVHMQLTHKVKYSKVLRAKICKGCLVHFQKLQSNPDM